jgi:hypothetical protein
MMIAYPRSYSGWSIVKFALQRWASACSKLKQPQRGLQNRKAATGKYFHSLLFTSIEPRE